LRRRHTTTDTEKYNHQYQRKPHSKQPKRSSERPAWLRLASVNRLMELAADRLARVWRERRGGQGARMAYGHQQWYKLIGQSWIIKKTCFRAFATPYALQTNVENSGNIIRSRSHLSPFSPVPA